MEKTVVCWAIVLVMCVTLGQAQGPDLETELWIAPADHPGNHAVGNWTVTAIGDTHFGFGIPANFDTLTKATIVLIPGDNEEITFDLLMSVAKNGEAENIATFSELEISATLVKEQLQEFDVSSIFSQVGNPVLGPDDYVSLLFEATPKADAEVFGMRLIYDRIPSLGNVGCAAGEVLTGFDEFGLPICEPSVGNEACPSGQVLTGFSNGLAQCENSVKDEICSSDQVLTGFVDGAPQCEPSVKNEGCADGEVLVRFTNGAAECVPSQANKECGPTEVLVGFTLGVKNCIPRTTLLAGVTCASGEALQGFDPAGAPLCVAIEGDLNTTPLPDGSTPPDGLPLLSIANASQDEGDSGMAGLTFTVTLTPTSPVAVTVQYATKDGTAQAGAVSGDGRNTVGGDYVGVAVATPGLLTIPPNTATGTFDIQINGDEDIENSEFFQVFLFNPSDALIDDGKGLGGIINDD